MPKDHAVTAGHVVGVMHDAVAGAAATVDGARSLIELQRHSRGSSRVGLFLSLLRVQPKTEVGGSPPAAPAVVKLETSALTRTSRDTAVSAAAASAAAARHSSFSIVFFCDCTLSFR